MGFDQDIICNVKLNLSLGGSVDRPENSVQFAYRKESTPSLKSDKILPSLTLSLSSDLTSQASPENHHFHGDQTQNMPPRPSSVSLVSSFFNSGVKREREVSYEEVEVEKGLSPMVADHDQDEEGGARKKLRLTKDQSVILEDSFKVHSTLNPTQKQELSTRLNLLPRQVEVWFQNRRARIKLKQTEVDCELLKKSCDKLTDENRRLRKELEELKVQKLPSPVYMQLPAATLSLCPSCEKISGAAAAAAGDNPSRISFSIGTRPHIYNPFTKPSAAC